ncbi:MAG: dephospho-CoA kinase [Clostridiales bacterium]|nr:dephospho-CoA kinase [Clostridiales bacterium]
MENSQAVKTGKIMGLTGGIGAGKSYAAALFVQRGFALIDADEVSRKIYQKGGKCYFEVIECFGRAILDNEENIDRKALAAIVFQDQEQLDKLNQIAHRHIMILIQKQVDALREKGNRYILLDAPQLFEAGADRMCDFVVSVIAPEALRLERVIRRDGVKAEQAMARMRMQYDDAFFTAHSDYVIYNDEKHDLAEQINKICSEVMEET